MENHTVDCPEAKKPKLYGEEYIQLKQKLKARKKVYVSIPRIRLLDAGEHASLSPNVKAEDRIPIFMNDVQHLLLYSMMGNRSPYLPDRWCKLDKYNRISHVIVCVIEGLSINHFVENEVIFENLTSKLDYRLELITPIAYGRSIIEELAAVPFTGMERAKLLNKFGTLEEALEKNADILKLFRTIFPMQPATNVDVDASKIKLPAEDKFPRTELVLSPYQLVEENYPIPLRGGLAKKYGDYVLTKDEYAEVHSKSKMYAIDCEMCKTTTGLLELTRISIVDEQLNTIYDTLVKPDNKITDYLTPYSGITEEMLKDVTTKLSDVQKFIRAFLPSDAILVGQSLNSDLQALRMMHPYIIDTSVIFNMTGDRYRKTKLKTLVSTFLNEKIQNSRAGHCSTEDSTASMKLVKLKLANSIDFGDSILIEKTQYYARTSRFRKDNRNTEKRIENMKPEHTYTVGSLIFSHISKPLKETVGKTAAIFGCSETMNDYSRIMKTTSLNIMDDKNFQEGDNVRLVITDSNKETVRRCSEIAMEHALNFCHLKLSKEELSEENTHKTLNTVDRWIKKLWKHTALNGMVCVIFSGDKNSSNGACFLSIKKNVDTENISESLVKVNV